MATFHLSGSATVPAAGTRLRCPSHADALSVARWLLLIANCMPPSGQHLWQQLLWLVILAIPIACVAWTVTREEVFRELREYCEGRSKACRRVFTRKFFYLFTCEYCFSHWVTLAFVALTRFRLLLDDGRGYIISFFALVWLANAYMNFYARIRVEITTGRKEIEVKQKEAEVKDKEIEVMEQQIQRGGGKD
jgi:hypothetical protein